METKTLALIGLFALVSLNGCKSKNKPDSALTDRRIAGVHVIEKDAAWAFQLADLENAKRLGVSVGTVMPSINDEPPLDMKKDTITITSRFSIRKEMESMKDYSYTITFLKNDRVIDHKIWDAAKHLVYTSKP